MVDQKKESTDEQINGNAIAKYFGQNSYLISSLKLMLETGDFWGCQIRDCASMARLDLSVIFSYYITNSVIFLANLTIPSLNAS